MKVLFIFKNKIIQIICKLINLIISQVILFVRGSEEEFADKALQKVIDNFKGIISDPYLDTMFISVEKQDDSDYYATIELEDILANNNATKVPTDYIQPVINTSNITDDSILTPCLHVEYYDLVENICKLCSEKIDGCNSCDDRRGIVCFSCIDKSLSPPACAATQNVNDTSNATNSQSGNDTNQTDSGSNNTANDTTSQNDTSIQNNNTNDINADNATTNATNDTNATTNDTSNKTTTPPKKECPPNSNLKDDTKMGNIIFKEDFQSPDWRMAFPDSAGIDVVPDPTDCDGDAMTLQRDDTRLFQISKDFVSSNQRGYYRVCFDFFGKSQIDGRSKGYIGLYDAFENQNYWFASSDSRVDLALINLPDTDRWDSYCVETNISPGSSVHLSIWDNQETESDVYGDALFKNIVVYDTPAKAMFTFLGCTEEHADIHDMLIWSSQNMFDTISKETCSAFCLAANQKYFGLLSGSGCTCGNKYGSYGYNSDCNMKCTSGNGQFCGGLSSNNVYLTMGYMPSLICPNKNLADDDGNGNIIFQNDFNDDNDLQMFKGNGGVMDKSAVLVDNPAGCKGNALSFTTATPDTNAIVSPTFVSPKGYYRICLNFYGGKTDVLSFRTQIYIGLHIDNEDVWLASSDSSTSLAKISIADLPFWHDICFEFQDTRSKSDMLKGVQFIINNKNANHNAFIKDVVIYSTPAKKLFTNKGCTQDDLDRDLSGTTFQMGSKASPQTCNDFCQLSKSRYFGLQQGNICYCGNSFSSYGFKSSCIMQCQGQDGLLCGGMSQNSVFLVNQDAMPVCNVNPNEIDDIGTNVIYSNDFNHRDDLDAMVGSLANNGQHDGILFPDPSGCLGNAISFGSASNKGSVFSQEFQSMNGYYRFCFDFYGDKSSTGRSGGQIGYTTEYDDDGDIIWLAVSTANTKIASINLQDDSQWLSYCVDFHFIDNSKIRLVLGDSDDHSNSQKPFNTFFKNIVVYNTPSKSLLTYDGCFDQLSIDAKSTVFGMDAHSSAQECRKQCVKMEMEFFGISNGQVCSCESTKRKSGYRTDCNVHCKGNSNQFCGGQNATMMFTTSGIQPACDPNGNFVSNTGNNVIFFSDFQTVDQIDGDSSYVRSNTATLVPDPTFCKGVALSFSTMTTATQLQAGYVSTPFTGYSGYYRVCFDYMGFKSSSGSGMFIGLVAADDLDLMNTFWMGAASMYPQGDKVKFLPDDNQWMTFCLDAQFNDGKGRRLVIQDRAENQNSKVQDSFLKNVVVYNQHATVFPTYLGCYQDNDRNNPDIGSGQHVKGSIEECNNRCVNKRKLYFGISENQCKCGNAYGQAKLNNMKSTGCNLRCDNNDAQICGGALKRGKDIISNSVFKTIGMETDPGLKCPDNRNIKDNPAAIIFRSDLQTADDLQAFVPLESLSANATLPPQYSIVSDPSQCIGNAVTINRVKNGGLATKKTYMSQTGYFRLCFDFFGVQDALKRSEGIIGLIAADTGKQIIMISSMSRSGDGIPNVADSSLWGSYCAEYQFDSITQQVRVFFASNANDNWINVPSSLYFKNVVLFQEPEINSSPNYLGCFNARSLDNMAISDIVMSGETNAGQEAEVFLDMGASSSVETCFAFCGANGAKISGIEQMRCHCGDTYGNMGSSSACFTRCDGDQDEFCGGFAKNSVYATPDLLIA